MPWIGAAAAVAGPLLGAAMTSDAAGSAANTQAGATDRATAATTQATQQSIAEMARQFNLTRSDLAPYRTAGTAGLSALQQLLGITPGAAPAPFGGVAGVPALPDGVTTGDPRRDAALALYNRDLVNGRGYALTPAEVTQPETQAQIDNILQNPGEPINQMTAPQSAPQATVDPNAPLTKKFSISDFWNDPVVQSSYQAGLDLGTKALKNAAPLTTGLDSGAALKELTKFGTDYTGNMAAGSQARYVGDKTNVFNKIAALTGVGQQATGTGANAGTTTAGNIANATMTGGTNVANLISGQGNAAAGAKIAGANAWGGGLQSVSNWWNQQNLMNRILGPGGGFGGGTGTPVDWTGTGSFPASSMVT